MRGALSSDGLLPRPEIETLYESRLGERTESRDRRKRRATLVSTGRVIVFGLGVWCAWLVWDATVLAWPWFLVPVAGFAVLMSWHASLRNDLAKDERSRIFYLRGLERLRGEWAGRGHQGQGFADPKHPYALDLDIFGKGSLFELLATTVSPWGTQRLSEWLTSAGAPAEVRARQAALQELAPRVELREALASEHTGLTEGVDASALASWAARPAELSSSGARILALALGAATVLAGLGWALSWWDRLVFFLAVVVAGVFAMAFRERVERVLAGVEKPARELSVLEVILERIETESFAAPRLVELQRSLSADGEPASSRIRSLRRLVEFLDARRNQMFAPIAFLVLWGTHFAFALESWRARSGAHVAEWLAVVGELDALLALSAYVYENPEDPFPILREDAVIFDAVGLGHPLIHADKLVRNDARFGTEPQLLVVSGSNMSGKSTFLRAIGINTVLAFAGAPVRAHRLELSPFAVAASIHIVDSLQDGISHFYAEILRLRQVLELASGSTSVMFLLDEILHGTNSHDRSIGAEAVVKGLLERGAVGLITTHDLALARMAETMGGAAVNVHFEDQIVDGKIEFDYRMRDGVVTKSNALDLMRSVGLDV